MSSTSISTWMIDSVLLKWESSIYSHRILKKIHDVWISNFKCMGWMTINHSNPFKSHVTWPGHTMENDIWRRIFFGWRSPWLLGIGIPGPRSLDPSGPGYPEFLKKAIFLGNMMTDTVELGHFLFLELRPGSHGDIMIWWDMLPIPSGKFYFWKSYGDSMDNVHSI